MKPPNLDEWRRCALKSLHEDVIYAIGEKVNTFLTRCILYVLHKIIAALSSSARITMIVMRFLVRDFARFARDNVWMWLILYLLILAYESLIEYGAPVGTMLA